MNVRAAGQGFDEESAHQAQKCRGHKNAAGSTHQRQQHPLGEHLAQQTRTSCADGYTHGHLAFTLDSARQQQSCDVDAADHQHGQHRGQQCAQRAFALLRDSIGQQRQTNRPPGIRIRISPAQVVEDLRQIGLRLLDAHAILHAPHSAQPVGSAPCHPALIDMHGKIDGILHLQRITEAGRHYADHGHAFAVHLDRFIQNAAITAKVTLPKLITQHRDVVLAFLLLAGQKGTAQQRLNAENLEEVIGPLHAVEGYCARVRRLDCHLDEVSVGRKCAECCGLRALILIAGPRGRLKVAALAAALREDDLFRVRIGQRAQDDIINDTEDRRGHAHAQSQREHDSEGESRSAAQLAQRIANVLKQRVHSRFSSTVENHSERKACMGSMEAARRAGMKPATKAERLSTKTAPVMASGSKLPTP